MRLSVLFAALLASGAATQQTTFRPTPTAGPGTTSTSLPELVSRLPRCALQCFSSAARDINCAPSNFSCLCANSGDLIAKVGPCAFLGCSSDDVSRATTLAPQICAAVNGNPSPSDIASASNLVTSALGTAAQTSSTRSPNAAPARTDVAAAMLGAAGAWAVLAL